MIDSGFVVAAFVPLVLFWMYIQIFIAVGQRAANIVPLVLVKTIFVPYGACL